MIGIIYDDTMPPCPTCGTTDWDWEFVNEQSDDMEAVCKCGHHFMPDVPDPIAYRFRPPAR
jgi:hypothetical protein